ncbi:GNAT family N-acetyltransferase [Streptomyces sp. SID8360]|nr:GCN5-related N-acetyltransferase [Streptomyces sp. SirexAA-E]MYR70434.1 GNAT family N-acetyltransferase [Streptomyces sp. SID4939]MYS00167.1 GNAT family N-acetyltransferase [Streptomyces sp. SID4940]MYT62328.1 GNAT family N-acetyltransferase [Streptomyces sp. SID8357]MYT83876.1 GNAT family N-acetyltransferase [Streptomyces sp. SID8360]MYW37955.1 GNAT family N-acetyltransferase [Streptomyces sp. SID1]PZX35508.1 acetyltransferase (GNAT) family protein [Streptomyces sp. DvalAA-21]RAJ29965.1 
MFRLETEVDKERRLLLGRRLHDANWDGSSGLRALRSTSAENEIPLDVWLLDEDGALAGGLSGRTWAYWLHVDLLWVDARHRGAGHGARLLAEAERVAREDRACTRSRLETWDFQAPAFYRKHGYEVAGEVEDYPPGVHEFILVKRLVRPETAAGRRPRGLRGRFLGRRTRPR